MIMITEPMKIVRLRPSMLPSQIVATAPKKHPRVYAPTVMAWIVAVWLAVLPAGGFWVSISGKYFRNDFRVKRPPITPWSIWSQSTIDDSKFQN